MYGDSRNDHYTAFTLRISLSRAAADYAKACLSLFFFIPFAVAANVDDGEILLEEFQVTGCKMLYFFT